MLPDERDHLPIALGSLAVLATGLVDHSEAIVAIVHVGEQHQEVAGGLLGLVELAGADEAGGGVGRDGQLVVVSVLGPREPRRNGANSCPITEKRRCAHRALARPVLVVDEAQEMLSTVEAQRGGTAGNVKLRLPPRQSRGAPAYARQYGQRYLWFESISLHQEVRVSGGGFLGS